MFNKTENHTHQVTGDMLARIEKAMCNTAVEAAKRAVATDRPTPSAYAGEASNGVGSLSNIKRDTPAPAPAPRLEPFHWEVKRAIETQKLSEKAAERFVRKNLLADAACAIKDDATRTFAFALIALL